MADEPVRKLTTAAEKKPAGLQRGQILALRERVWIDVPEIPGLELEIDPSEAALLGTVVDNELTDRRICERVLTGFRGYEDDGKAVPNTLEARLELWSVPLIRRRVNNKTIEISDRIVQGEGSGGSA